MLRELVLFCLFYQSHVQGAKIQGKLDIDKGMASVFHEVISEYLNDNTKNVKTEININKLLKNFQDFTNNGQENGNKNVKLVNNPHTDEDSTQKFKQSNVDAINVKIAKDISLHVSKARKNRRHRQVTKGMMDDRKEKREKKRKSKNREENYEKKREIKNVEENYEKKGDMNNVDENKGNKREEKNKNDNEQKKTENNNHSALREKTILEEIIGMERSVHVYGKHKGDQHDLPLNNIKA